MCYNCGCGEPDEDMGHPENITTETFAKAAKASSQEAKQAREETYKLLKAEFETSKE